MPNKESMEQAAQAWCRPETEHLEMIPELATVFAEMLDTAFVAGQAAIGRKLENIPQFLEGAI